MEDHKLSHVKTVEPMSATELAAVEMNREATLDRLNSFDKSSLKTTITEEKILLPDAGTITIVSGREKIKNPCFTVCSQFQEKQQVNQQEILREVETFEATKLRSTSVEERSNLPSADDIHAERLHRELLTDIGDFDQGQLSHAETAEKVSIPDQEVIEQEKQHNQFVASVENFDVDGLKHVEEVRETTEPAVIVEDAVGGDGDKVADDRQRSSSGDSSGSGSAKTKESSDSWEKVEENQQNS